jgi:hypothetical protein
VADPGPLDLLLRAAIVDGSDASYEAYRRAGSAAVHHFRDYLAGTREISLPAMSDPRGQMDNTVGVSPWLAGRYPEEYLTTFNSAEWLKPLTGSSDRGIALAAADSVKRLEAQARVPTCRSRSTLPEPRCGRVWSIGR